MSNSDIVFKLTYTGPVNNAIALIAALHDDIIN